MSLDDDIAALNRVAFTVENTQPIWGGQLRRVVAAARSARPEALLKEPTEEMIEAGADAFLQAKDAWQAAQPKGFGATCPLMVTLPAAYKAMVASVPSPPRRRAKPGGFGDALDGDGLYVNNGRDK